MTGRKLVSGGLLVAVLTVASAAHAQATAQTGKTETADIEGLLNESIVTTASKSAQTGSSAPGQSTILTAEDMRRYGMHSLDEAIDFLSLGVATSKTMRGAEIGSRGVLISNDQGNHFLLLVNGHAVNEELYGAARFDRGAGIPMEMVDHIEVIVGPGSVLYGSNAMLGVINVITKQARSFSGTHLVLESELLTSWRAATGGGYDFRLFGSRAEVTTELEYYRQRGPSFSVGPQRVGQDIFTLAPYRLSRNGPPTGVWGGTLSESNYADVPSGLLRFKWRDLEINLHASLYKRGVPSYPRSLEPNADFDDPQNYELDRSIWADIKQRVPLSSIAELTARVYGDTFDYERYADISAKYRCQYVGVNTCRRGTFGNSRWGGAELQASFDWLQDSRLTTLFGVDGRLRTVSGKTDLSNYDTQALLASSTGLLRETDGLVGVYIQQTWDPSEWFGLNAGGRLDIYQRFGEHFSPRVAASTQPWRDAALKAVYSEAFRAPSWYEAKSAVGSQIPAEHLSPETVRSIELSLDQKLGTHRLVWGVFRSWWQDMVELYTLTPAELSAARQAGLAPFAATTGSQFRNVSSIENYGFNMGYEGSLAQSRLHYGANVTSAIARKVDSAGAETPVTVAPRVFGNARIAYELPQNLPTLAVAAHYLARRPADRAFDSGWNPSPYAPAQLELRGTVSGPMPAIKGLSYRASANYAFASVGAHAIGISQNAAQGLTNAPELNPIDTFRVTVGLQYDL